MLYLCSLELFASVSLAEFKEMLPCNEASIITQDNYQKDKRIRQFDGNLV